MKFKFVDEILSEHQIVKPSLNVLRDGGELARYAILQPQGDVIADENGVKNSVASKAHEKVKDFVISSKNNNCDVVVTPEYFTPWAFISDISGGLAPNREHLWVLCFESITPDGLDQIKTQNANLKFIYSIPEGRTGNFLNPLVYIFWSKNQNDEEVLVALVQFKTVPMSETTLHLERRHLIRGDDVYVFRVRNSIHLLSIICSDALEFDPRDIDRQEGEDFGVWNNLPFILLHPQLNKQPAYPDFKKYRFDWLSQGIERKHVICVNYSTGTQINGYQGGRTDFGRSSLYFKERFGERHEHLLECHNKGLYYTSYRRAHCFFFNFDEHVFDISLCKVARTEVGLAPGNHPAPFVNRTDSWNMNNWIQATNISNGYHAQCRWNCQSPTYAVLRGSAHHDELIKEIIINRAVGFSISTQQNFMTLESTNITDAETIRRLTFLQDKSTEATQYVSGVMGQFDELCLQILTSQNELPPQMKNASNITLGLFDDGFNLSLGSNHKKAIVAFIGTTDEPTAKAKFSEIQKAIKKHNSRAICVWYKTFGSYSKVFIENTSITYAPDNIADIAGDAT